MLAEHWIPINVVFGQDSRYYLDLSEFGYARAGIRVLALLDARFAEEAIMAYPHDGLYKLYIENSVAFLEIHSSGGGWVSSISGTGPSHKVRTKWDFDPQDIYSGHVGPGYLGTPSTRRHRFAFWVDFASTPDDPTDDQFFDGYLLKIDTYGAGFAFAGVTWQSGVPIGFYAVFERTVG